MHLSRRQALGRAMGFIGATALTGVTGSALGQSTSDYAQAMRAIMGGRWGGIASTPNSAFESGKFAFEVSYKFTLDDDLSFGGDYRITTQFGGSVYHGAYALNGQARINSGKVSFDIQSTSFLSGDDLPSELYWQGMTGSLDFYKDSDDDGNYLLEGTLYGEQDNAPFDVQISYR